MLKGYLYGVDPHLTKKTCATECRPLFLLLFSSQVMSDSLLPQGLQPARLLYLCNFPGKNTGMGYHFLLQGILTQGSNLCLLNWQGDFFFTTEPSGKPRSLFTLGLFKFTKKLQSKEFLSIHLFIKYLKILRRQQNLKVCCLNNQ